MRLSKPYFLTMNSMKAMKINSIYSEILDQLTSCGVENPAFEAKELVKYFFHMSETDFLLSRNKDISDDICIKLKNAVSRRASGEPLQYIIGEWDFMDSTFKVGEGVLIPRPETEILCQYVLDNTKKIDKPVIYDLCSGSGCIAISIKKEIMDSQVIAVEKSDKAFAYLTRNNKLICKDNAVVAVNEDIFNYDHFVDYPYADVIISNPPYIRSDEIAGLQKEVQYEPKMALDGGEDGLVFYRFIISVWKNKLKTGGFFAFECGEDQAFYISQLLNNSGFDSEIIKDYNNIDRIVIGRRL